MKINEWPEKGELVVVKVKKIMDYGAYLELLEYPGKEAFVHISKVATHWVKNIRSILSEGQIRVGIVERVDPSKNAIDVSFRKVSAFQEKEKMNEWKREKRADKMFEQICKRLGVDMMDAYKEIALPLIEKYGDLYSALEAGLHESLGLPEEWEKEFRKIAEEQIKPKEVTLKGEMKISVPGGDGVLKIKDILLSHTKKADIVYLSAPKYQIKLVAPDYETGEKELANIISDIQAKVTSQGGVFSFQRIKE